MSEEIESTPENVVPLMVDPFVEYWNAHPVNSSGLAPEVISQFKTFAADVWNAARYDMALRYSDLLLGVTNEIKGETRHETAMRYISEKDAEMTSAKARHAELSSGK